MVTMHGKHAQIFIFSGFVIEQTNKCVTELFVKIFIDLLHDMALECFSFLFMNKL